MSRRWISPHRPSRGDDDDEEFPRRFPRTGGSFQARTIPDIATEYKSERRTPQVMSQGLPFLTEAEAAVPESAPALATGPSPWSSSTRSGSFLEPGYENGWLEESTPADNRTEIQTWKDSLLDWQQEQTLTTTMQGTGRKARSSTKKRPRQQQQVAAAPLPQRPRIDPQEWTTTWVRWSGGGAVKRQRKERADWRETEPIWIWGDFRNNSNPTSSGRLAAASEQEDVAADEAVWKAVHACAVSWLRKSPPGPIYVSQVVRFLEYCRRLRSPQEVVSDVDERRDINQDLKRVTDTMQDICLQQAKLMDLWNEEGVEVDTLRKELEAIAKHTFRLDEADYLERPVELVLEWQARVDELSTKNTKNDLEAAQNFAKEAAAHGVRTKGLLQLEAKLEKALQLRQRIRDWMTAEEKESIKALASLVRDVQRLKWQFPETIQICAVYQEAELWVDRANIAIRSRMALREMRKLIGQAEQTLPVAVDDLLDKLRTRVEVADRWLEGFEEVVPRPEVHDDSVVNSVWLKDIRKALQDESFSQLHELASEGARLPVQVDAVEILQIELEARSWTVKAERWKASVSKRPKLDEMRDHVRKAQALRERLTMLGARQRTAWELPGEEAMQDIVKAADDWLKRYDSEVCNDTVPLSRLRELSAEAKSIHVHLGPATLKLSKLLVQAEDWFRQYEGLWKRCCLEAIQQADLAELRAAVKTANSDLAVDLKEAADLEAVVERIETWADFVAVATGAKGRRGRKGTFSVDDLERLVREASTLPVETEGQVIELRKEIGLVREWQARASQDLEEIVTAFETMRKAMNVTYGSPAAYKRSIGGKFEADDNTDPMEVENDEKPTSFSNLQTLVESFRKEAAALNTSTPEAESARTLEVVTRWCMESLKYLENQRDIFDKRFFGAFDRFFSEGKTFCNKVKKGPSTSALLQQLDNVWSSVVNDQLQRLKVILSDREDYIRWCEAAEVMLEPEDNRRPSLEKLTEMADRSLAFGGCDLVDKVRKLSADANNWSEKAKGVLSSGMKLPVAEAKSLIDEAGKIFFNCTELRKLKNGMKAARGWAGRVKRSKVDQGAIQVKVVQRLVDEYDELLVEMPEDISKIRQAVKNYCICRRPYEGFMIGCDGCGEWFHGPCIGISESKAGRVDKFSCIRCCISRTFDSSATMVAGIIRKWTSKKDLKKARQAAAQKHQRRVRKETKAIEKLEMEQKELLEKLAKSLNATTKSQSSDPAISPNSCGRPSSLVNAGSARIDGAQSQTLVAAEVSVGNAPGPATSASLDIGSKPAKDMMGASASVTNDALGTPESIKERLGKVTGDIESCRDRLTELSVAHLQRQDEDDREDKGADLLRKWCIRVRSFIIAPISDERARQSRPKPDGSLSNSMLTLRDEAEKFGLLSFEDPKIVTDSFDCMAWALRATSVMSRQPSADEVLSLVKTASSLNLPDEKALRMLKALSQRASSWQKRAAKALMPVPGESKPFDVSVLRNLCACGDDIPLAMPFESRLLTVIEDKGSRHCVCGGPSDGRFMLGCDKCEAWFHGHCVGVSKESLEEDEEWKCPSCNGCSIAKVDVRRFHEQYADDTDSDSHADTTEDISSKAPKTADMWPPCGYLGSTKAVDALGKICCAIPDSTDEWKVEHRGIPQVVQVPLLPATSGLRTRFSVPVSVTNSASPSSEQDGPDDVDIHLVKPSTATKAAVDTAWSVLRQDDTSGNTSSMLPVGEGAEPVPGHSTRAICHPAESLAVPGSLTSAGSRMPNVPCKELSSCGNIAPVVGAARPADAIDLKVAKAPDPLDIANAIQREILVATVQDALRRE